MTFPVRLCGNEITEATVAEHRVTLGAILAGTALDAGVAPDVGIGELAQRTKAPHADWTPLVTVAVCTRDRADDLARCLDALCRLDYPTLDFLVVDNAPATGFAVEGGTGRAAILPCSARSAGRNRRVGPPLPFAVHLIGAVA